MDKKLLEVLTLVLALNEHTKDDFFFNYLGHVDEIEVDYYEGGYDASKDRTKLLETFIDQDDDAEKKLDKTINELKRKLVDAVMRGELT